jgi:hypothetical protein
MVKIDSYHSAIINITKRLPKDLKENLLKALNYEQKINRETNEYKIPKKEKKLYR